MISKASVKRCIHRAIARLVAVILHSGAVYDPANFRIWESRGYHITPVHFYYPIPDTRELARLRYPRISGCPGVDLRSEFQVRLLMEVFSGYAQEDNAILTEQSRGGFHLDNDAFTGIDPFVYYCMIRHFQPRTIIEIGSGFSTLLAAQSKSTTTKLVAVDPWPRGFMSSGTGNVDLIRSKVEDLDMDFFQQLHQDDILFVDSTHVVRTGGDVCFLILEVLPRLTKGVIVHFHDIFLPYDYPKEWLMEQHRFWTEQYLLQAYLADNCQVEVLFASNFMAHEYPQETRAIFPKALWWGGGSFWIRKIG